MLSGAYTFEDQVSTLRVAIHEILGWHYHGPASPPAAFLPMNGFGMVVTRGEGFAFRGAVDGIAYGAQRFALADVTARKFEPKNYGDDPIRAGFEGVILSLNHPEVFHGRTIIRRDMKRLNPGRVDGMKRVGMVDLEFERLFEVYSDDQVEARALLTPDFIERMTNFADDFLGRGVQLAFLGGQVHISLEIDDRFNFNRNIKAFDFREGSASVLNEIGGIFTVLEAAQTLQSCIGRRGAAGADKARHSYYRELMQLLRTEVENLESNWDNSRALPDGLRDTHYMFCDGIKGLLSPRF